MHYETHPKSPHFPTESDRRTWVKGRETGRRVGVVPEVWCFVLRGRDGSDVSLGFLKKVLNSESLSRMYFSSTKVSFRFLLVTLNFVRILSGRGHLGSFKRTGST